MAKTKEDKAWLAATLKTIFKHAGISDMQFISKTFYVCQGEERKPLSIPSFSQMTLAYLHEEFPDKDERDLMARSYSVVEFAKTMFHVESLPPPMPHHTLLADGRVIDGLTGKVIANKKEFYLFNSIAANHDPSAECPVFMQYLDDVFAGVEDAQDRKNALQEFAGSMFIHDTRFQVFMLLFGSGGEGKSIFLSAIRSVLGESLTANISLGQLGDKFKIYHFKGALANLSDESNNKQVENDVLKALTTGNPIMVEQKGKTPETFRNYSKMIFAANQYPYFKDWSEGMDRRMIVIGFPNKVEESKRDVLLEEKIVAERDGIFLWMLEGLQRLLATGKITIPPSSVELVKTMMQSDPITAFINEKLIKLPFNTPIRQLTLKADVYAAYRRYCEANDIEHVLSRNSFSKRMAEKNILNRKSNGKDFFVVSIGTSSTGNHAEKDDDDEEDVVDSDPKSKLKPNKNKPKKVATLEEFINGTD